MGYNYCIGLCLLLLNFTGIQEIKAQKRQFWSTLKEQLDSSLSPIILKDSIPKFTFFQSEAGKDLNLANIRPKLEIDYLISANDKHFCCYLRYSPELSIRDSVKIAELSFIFGKKPIVYPRNEAYLYLIEDDLKYSLKDEYESLAKNLKCKKLSNDFSAKFNADRAFSYFLKLRKIPSAKYQYCQVFVLSKNGIGYLMLYCFYKHEKNLQKKYLSQIEKLFRFKDVNQSIIEEDEFYSKPDRIYHF